ncbi:hypothetical protein VW29_02580 [Devosia limi DSM 17137]|uniref:Uncharacterized protein n=1 Tax=Devosia limi DSM 17137 TaxID=1121477 RepID=A0A0F5LXS7_9HYPH|nr:hypothetical protein [Devosia limi]KKB86462.1 hypothetical protein VW29_02580 [Devosia limi DSM 17137]SHE88083.1 hypothetical protein SAMN02745223_01306 [Devosia limi DSM 17137]
MKLIAVKAMRYAGKNLQPGDEFAASNERDGRTLKAIRKATDAPDGVSPTSSAAAPKPTPSENSPTRKRGNSYQTRRMQAKD